MQSAPLTLQRLTNDSLEPRQIVRALWREAPSRSSGSTRRQLTLCAVAGESQTSSDKTGK